MSTTALTSSRKPTRAIKRPHPLLAVIAWELCRFRTSRRGWWILLLAFGFFLFVIWLLWIARFAGNAAFGNGATFTVSVTSAEGLVMILPTLTFLLALIVPFVNADGIARDLKQRTHELLMSTPLPTWAYFWGRYAACVLLSLGLAVVLLVALLLMGLILHQTQADYPLPQVEAIALIWTVALAPTTTLISSVTFALGTVLQRRSSLAVLGMILSWFVCTVVLPVIPVAGSGKVPSWYLHWEPTNIGMAALLQAPYAQGASAILNSTSSGGSDSSILSALANLEQQMPDLGPWILPHLIWIGLGLALVLIAGCSFKRFRNVPS
jgi:ABC-type transport system involved in multi-copper enzyme maturation permease subunit